VFEICKQNGQKNVSLGKRKKVLIVSYQRTYELRLRVADGSLTIFTLIQVVTQLH